MAHLLNFPGDIKGNPVDASSAIVIRPTEKEIPLPDIKMHVSEELLVQLYQMDTQCVYRDGITEQLNGRTVKTKDDGKICVHDTLMGDLQKTFESGHKRGIRRVEVWDGPRPEGPQIITCSYDGTLKVFNFDGKMLRDLAKPAEGMKGRDKIGHIGAVMCMAIAKDEPYSTTDVASGGEDTSVRIWSLKTGKQIAACHGHETPIVGVTFCVGRANMKLVASIDEGGEIRFWKRDDGELMRIITPPGAAVEKYY
jgi:WD40 repeat protein